MEEKERLTNKEELKRIELSSRINTKYVKSYFLYSQLFEYENTNLSPAEAEQLKKENAELKAELEELKKNAIVPKFNKGEECYAFTGHCAYFSNDKVNILDIELKYKCKNDLEQIIYCENSLYKTFEQAEEALKRLEEK